MTQDRRRRTELAADYFVPDERDLADLVLFGQRFAKHIQYYDANNTKAGDWGAFFENDVTAGLAALAKLPVEAFRSFQLDLENWLRADPGRDSGQLSAHAKLLFHLPTTLVEIAGAHQARLPNDHPLVPAIVRLTGRDLAEPLTGVIAWYKGAVAEPIFTDTALVATDYNIAGTAADPRVRLSSTLADAVLGRPAFSAAPVPDPILSQVAPGTWAGLYAATAEDKSPYRDANDLYEQIYDALSYNLLTTAIEHVYQGMERIRRDAATHLTDSLERFAKHASHYGLWLAFLQLFEHARGEMNRFTRRHLDFYFRELLRLSLRSPEPDKVHLLFELAKGRTAHRLPAGTLFRAGKDALGRAVAYALENDIVVNGASVVELRGLQIATTGTMAAPTQTPRAALVVRSRDGLGEVDLVEDEPSWPAFGPAVSPAARVGFAIADRKLFLREGTRTIRIRAELKAPISSTDIAPRWVVRLTGDKGWFEVAGTAQIETKLDNGFMQPVATVGSGKKGGKIGSTRKKGTTSVKGEGKDFFTLEETGGRFPDLSKPLRVLEINVSLSPDDAPVVPLDAKLHGAEHAPGVPVVEVVFDFAAHSAARAFAVLRDIRVDQVTLRTEASGLKDLMVVADGGVVDVSKPFPPFGAQPRVGSPLVIGSSEIFSKRIDAWGLKIDWGTAYSKTGFFWSREAESYNPFEAVLSGGRWVPVPLEQLSDTIEIGKGHAASTKPRRTDIHLGEVGGEVPLASAGLIDGRTQQSIENPPLEARSVNGFMRMRLPLDFGHAAFGRENTRALVGLAGGTTYAPSSGVNAYKPDANQADQLPREPYSPVVTRLEAAYKTRRDRIDAFSLLHPFGISDGTADGRLFPDLPFEGAILVGVAGFEAPARLTLLIQVSDGSGDPLKPAPDLEFAFLDGDEWVPFEPQDLDDKTVNFTGSGVLGLNLPEGADTGHGLLPTGLHWIRIAARRDADALNRLLSVDAQAARLAFSDAGNDPAFLETPLPVGSISKLVTPDLAIKKIIQPYGSFDGRPVEAPDAFATRVSERLRHKDRAVTMFDYEALVLEAFPHLYRVKCLNTTELKRNSQGHIVADNELMPGAVTVVTVPWTQGRNNRDPLRPYVDQATLTAVDTFLRRRISPFVRLEIQNPKFEEVQVDFKVRFTPEIGDIAFYIDELNNAVIRYLTPWARPDGGEVGFGGRLWKSSIIDFVEEWPRVDFVTEFRLYHKVDLDAPLSGWSPVDVEVVEATTARSILVSAARHVINEVPGNA